MAKLRIPISTAALVCLVLAGACADDDDSGTDGSTVENESDSSAPADPTDATGADGTEAPDGDANGDIATTMRGRFASDTTLLDPIYVANAADIAVVSIIIETLVAVSPDGEVVNVLADTWEISPDGLQIDFTLKQGVQFHGGYGEMTMDDVKFSIERAAGLIESVDSTSITAFYTALERVEAVDEYTGRLVMSEPSVTLVQQALPLTGIISKAAFDAVGLEAFQLHPIGTGPYQFDEVVPGEHVRLTNFTEYTGAAPYVPDQRFDELVFQIIPEDSAAELAYEAGDLDLLAPMRAAAVSRFEELDDTVVTQGGSMTYRWIGMNVLDPALSNPDLRQAIIAAIDVPSIIQATSEGKDVRANALVAPSAPIGYWEDAPVHEQDLDEARRLVELVPEADRTLSMTIGDDEMSRTVAQIAQANLQDAGLTVEIETLDAASFFVTGESNRERQLFYTEFGINYREPTQELLWFTCDQVDIWNYMYWCDEEYSALFAAAQTELDAEARNQIYVDMQQIWEEAAHTVWISYPTNFIAARSDTVEVVSDAAGTVYYQALIPK